MLVVLGVADIAYGAALIDVQYASPETYRWWWPASLGAIFGIPLAGWGLLWIAVGVFLFTGVPRRWPDWPQFGAAVALKVWWAFAAVISAAVEVTPGSWAPGALYVGFAVIVLISAGWEEPE